MSSRPTEEEWLATLAGVLGDAKGTALIAAMKRRPIRYALLDLDYHSGHCTQIDFEGDGFGATTERQFVAAHRHG